MEFLFDCANIDYIKKYSEIFPITGVTTNPSIIKTEGKIDFFSHFKKIREIIGKGCSLHIQVLAEDYEGILAEAAAILENVDESVYIKVPTTEEGLRAMRELKRQNILVTATAIYTKIQGFMAIACDVDFIAPYYNRMENIGVSSKDVIVSLRHMINENKSNTKILAASFKNINQVINSFEAGAHCATIQPLMLHDMFKMPDIQKAIDDFRSDWINSQGNNTLIINT